jgi:hypothetical protein
MFRLSEATIDESLGVGLCMKNQLYKNSSSSVPYISIIRTSIAFTRSDQDDIEVDVVNLKDEMIVREHLSLSHAPPQKNPSAAVISRTVSSDQCIHLVLLHYVSAYTYANCTLQVGCHST